MRSSRLVSQVRLPLHHNSFRCDVHTRRALSSASQTFPPTPRRGVLRQDLAAKHVCSALCLPFLHVLIPISMSALPSRFPNHLYALLPYVIRDMIILTPSFLYMALCVALKPMSHLSVYAMSDPQIEPGRAVIPFSLSHLLFLDRLNTNLISLRRLLSKRRTS